MRLPENSRDLPSLAAETDPQDFIPEQRLLAAMLERAILDLRSQVPLEQHIRRECLAWVQSKDTDKWSFNWVCLHLDFDPSVFRKLAQTVYFDETKVSRMNTNRRGGNKSKPGITFKPAPHIRLT